MKANAGCTVWEALACLAIFLTIAAVTVAIGQKILKLGTKVIQRHTQQVNDTNNTWQAAVNVTATEPTPGQIVLTVSNAPRQVWTLHTSTNLHTWTVTTGAWWTVGEPCRFWRWQRME